jgi:TetR/AcrR family transcriptional regulator, mexJK operon transcriptional repressor
LRAERLTDAAALRRVPRGETRRRELARVAEDVFLQFGYTDATMQTIASRAGASKETLYRHFVSKEALFAEVVHAHAVRLLGPCDGLVTSGDPRHVLREVGLNLFRSMNGQDGLSIFRIVVGEAQRSPELGAIFLRHGPGLVHELLSNFLADATARGRMRCEDAAQATRLFLGAVLGSYHCLSLVDPCAPPLSDALISAHVEAAVAMFMSCYGVGGPSHMLG